MKWEFDVVKYWFFIIGYWLGIFNYCVNRYEMCSVNRKLYGLVFFLRFILKIVVLIRVISK